MSTDRDRIDYEADDWKERGKRYRKDIQLKIRLSWILIITTTIVSIASIIYHHYG
jgi:hypothetical protein